MTNVVTKTNQASAIKLIVGLGNPGAQYTDTRHNAGFWLIDEIARQHHILLGTDKKFHGITGRGQVFGQDVRLLMPTTFMNKSGQSVVPMAKFFGISASELVIAHDELDIPAGSVKLKTGGGHGGHNGLKDITPHIGNDFHRIRIGIGHPGDKSKVSGYVLSKPSTDDRVSIDASIDAVMQSLEKLVNGDFESARNHINGFKLL